MLQNITIVIIEHEGIQNAIYLSIYLSVYLTIYLYIPILVKYDEQEIVKKIPKIPSAMLPQDEDPHSHQNEVYHQNPLLLSTPMKYQINY
tara:strand:- start:480 stop:749 length:270 start_codon:yes stop_codon:yes gene_type:complete